MVKNKFKESIKSGTFKVGVMGISTTAGHDCHHNQSYVHVFQRHMQTVMNTANVRFETRNQGMGGLGPLPNTLCVEAIVGNDVDVIVWDYMMMAPRADCSVEFFTRAAQAMPSEPVVLMWQGGVWLPETGKFDGKNVKPKRSNPKQECNRAWMVNYYSGIGAHSADLGVVLHYLAYLGGVRSLENGTDPLFMDPLKGAPTEPDFSEPRYTPYTGQAQGRRRLARHHPGPMFHRIWGLTWAHSYLGLLIDAMHEVANVDHVAPYKRQTNQVKGCDKKFCENVLPKCHITLRPRSSISLPLEDLAEPGHKWQIIDGDGRAKVSAEYGYVDLKMVLSAYPKDGPITLKFNVEHPDLPVTLCEVPCPWGRCKQQRVPMLGNVKIEFDGTVITDFPNVKPFTQKDMCFVVVASALKGEHRLTVTAAGGENNNVIFSHLIHY
mmetsp:Transcript_97082/g.277793  ORF Transcript_97082/g.277793 Transcript_97082/m.277793 type:complete len:436 (+) Transcript_97082:419-1726(+)